MFYLAAVAALALAAPDVRASTASTPIDPDQKVRCQRQEVTGSLISVKKVCHTAAEWRQMADDATRDATRAVEQGYICPACQGK